MRRPHWREGHYWIKKEGKIFDSSGQEINDFEEVEEKKTLSDEIIELVYLSCDGMTCEMIRADDVKEKIKEFIEDIVAIPLREMDREAIMQKANFRFGRRLM